MSIHHTLEEKHLIIQPHELGARMVELIECFHIRDHFLYILLNRYKKYNLKGLDKPKNIRSTEE